MKIARSLLSVLCSGLALGILTRVAPAQAEGIRRVTLEYSDAASCGTPEKFWQALRNRTRLLKEASPRQADTTLSVRIMRSANGVTGVIRISAPLSTPEARQLSGNTCDAVLDGLALVAALHLDPEAHRTAAEGSAASPSKSAAPTPSNKSERPASTPTTPSQASQNQAPPSHGAANAAAKRGNSTSLSEAASQEPTDSSLAPALRQEREPTQSFTSSSASGPFPFRFGVGAQMHLCQPVTPTPQLGFGVLLTAQHEQVPISAELELNYGSSSWLDHNEPVRHHLMFAKLAAVLRHAFTQEWHLVLGPQVQLGRLVAAGQNFEFIGRSERTWLTVGGEIGASYAVTRNTELRLLALGSVPLFPQIYEVGEPSHEAGRTPMIVFGGALSFLYHFDRAGR